MAESTYPKIKYQGVPDPEPKPYDHNKPGFIYQKVNSPEEEKALEGDWSDTPAEAMKSAPKGNAPAAASGHKTEEWPTESEKRKR